MILLFFWAFSAGTKVVSSTFLAMFLPESKRDLFLRRARFTPRCFRRTVRGPTFGLRRSGGWILLRKILDISSICLTVYSFPDQDLDKLFEILLEASSLLILLRISRLSAGELTRESRIDMIIFGLTVRKLPQPAPSRRSKK